MMRPIVQLLYLLWVFVIGSQALFTRDDDTSDEEEDDTDSPDVIAADELQAGGVSEIPSSKQRWLTI